MMETDVDSVGAVTTEIIEMETEMAADLAREDHRAARDVSEEKTEITVVKDALADRTTKGGQRSGGARRSGGGSDAIFTPELTKTSKDSKRERDRENKNKKKDFDKTSVADTDQTRAAETRCPESRKALQKPAPQQKQEEKKPEIKEITIPEKLTIRELAEAMKMQPSAIVKKLFMEGQMVTVNHEIDFEQAEEIALGFDIIAEKEEKSRCN